MAPASNEEQFKFLISCIRYSNNGKVDFGEVAKECNIVSKGAAAKRYERMMKAHGIHQPATSVRDIPIPSRRKEESKPPTAASKKRKFELFSDANDCAVDDDEGLSKVKSEGPITTIKEEPTTGISSTASSQDLTGNTDDSRMFCDFLQSGAFDQDASMQQTSLDEGLDHGDLGNLSVSSSSGSGLAATESILIL